MKWWAGFPILLICVIYCEFLADYVALRQCEWPKLEANKNGAIQTDDGILKALILADVHLLGPLRGHFLDKFYREWHMSGAYQAAVRLLRPNLIFVLGDLFDEGDLVNHDQFNAYIERFHRYFHATIDASVPLISAVGNHDVGFHYRLHPYFTERFEQKFNNTGVNLYSFEGVHFVLINSMAMENDNCDFCLQAISDLKRIASDLDCLKSGSSCPHKKLLKERGKYSRPILMQHFPTHRISDKVCLESDAPNIEHFRENWEVLSKDSTDLLGKLLNPRVSFAGHSHHFCRNINRLGIEEYTVASFNWRNKVDPSFLLAKFSSEDYGVSKCDMLRQQTVYNIYIAASVMFLILEVIALLQYAHRRYQLARSSRISKIQ